MKLYPFVVAAFFALPASPALAADELYWPLPWQAGASLDYATEERTISAAGDADSRTTSDTRVRILSADESGFVQEWVATDLRHEEPGQSDPQRARLAQALATGFDGFPVQARLDTGGTYLGLANVEAIGDRLRDVVATVLQDAHALDALDATQREQADLALQVQVDTLVEDMLAPAAIESMLGQEVDLFNAFAGARLRAGQWYETETVLQTQAGSPLGEARLPAKLRFVMDVSQETQEDLVLQWNITIDAEAGLEAAWALADRLVDAKATPADRGSLPVDVTVRDEGFFLVHRETGVPEMVERTRTERVGDASEVTRSRMRQMDNVHGHAWTADGESAVPTSGDAP
jgi:hypothetical protein